MLGLDTVPRILTLGFSWMVMRFRLHALTDIVMGKMPPVPTEQEDVGTQSGYGCFGGGDRSYM